MATCEGLFLNNPLDALLAIQATRYGILRRVSRRLSRNETESIRSGTLCVYIEGESQILRWTDKKKWTQSRILGPYLVYRETKGQQNRGHKSKRRRSQSDEMSPSMKQLVGPINGDHLKGGGLNKKTFSVPMAEGNYHVVSYFNDEDAKKVQGGKLPTPSKSRHFEDIEVGKDLWEAYKEAERRRALKRLASTRGALSTRELGQSHPPPDNSPPPVFNRAHPPSDNSPPPAYNRAPPPAFPPPAFPPPAFDRTHPPSDNSPPPAYNRAPPPAFPPPAFNRTHPPSDNSAPPAFNRAHPLVPNEPQPIPTPQPAPNESQTLLPINYYFAHHQPDVFDRNDVQLVGRNGLSISRHMELGASFEPSSYQARTFSDSILTACLFNAIGCNDAAWDNTFNVGPCSFEPFQYERLLNSHPYFTLMPSPHCDE